MNELKNIIFDVNGKEYEFSGGGSGGDGTRPAPNSVGTVEIEDEGVKKEDLDKSIQDKLDILDESNVVTEDELEDGWAEAVQNAGLSLTTEVATSSGTDDSGD